MHNAIGSMLSGSSATRHAILSSCHDDRIFQISDRAHQFSEGFSTLSTIRISTGPLLASSLRPSCSLQCSKDRWPGRVGGLVCGPLHTDVELAFDARMVDYGAVHAARKERSEVRH